MKIAVNRCYGGFSLSKAVFTELDIEWGGYGYLGNENFELDIEWDGEYDAYRSHPKLIAAIEKLGVDKSSGPFAKIEIVEIPDGVSWTIVEYDGIESIHESHRSW